MRITPKPVLEQIGNRIAEAGQHVFSVQVGSRWQKATSLQGVADVHLFGVGIDDPGDLPADDFLEFGPDVVPQGQATIRLALRKAGAEADES